MKKVPLYLIIFLLTTGFFKSNLEKCADYNFKLSNVLPTSKFERRNVPEAVYKMRYEEYQKEQIKLQNAYTKIENIMRKKWYDLPKCSNPNKKFTFGSKVTCKNATMDLKYYTWTFKNVETPYLYNDYIFMQTFIEEPSKTEVVEVRKYTKNEIKRSYDKFLRQSLKVKLRLADQSVLGGKEYLDIYNACVVSREKNPQLFKDKYN